MLITVNRLGVLVLGVSKIVRAVKITGKPLFSMTNNLYSTKIIIKNCGFFYPKNDRLVASQLQNFD